MVKSEVSKKGHFEKVCQTDCAKKMFIQVINYLNTRELDLTKPFLYNIEKKEIFRGWT